MKQAFKLAGLFLLWNLAVSAALLLAPAPWSAVAAVVLLWLFLVGLMGRGRGRRVRRRWARLRLRPPTREALGWSAVLAPVLFVGAGAAGTVWGGLVEVPPESANPFLPMLETWEGRLSVAVYVIAVAPVAEEWLFRGLVQRPLERRMGVGRGIALAAAFFAAAHLLPRVFPLLWLLGAAFGYVTWATRSIWPAVLLHAVYNATSLAVTVLGGISEEEPPTIWQTGPTSDWWSALAVLVLCAAAWVPLARRLRAAGRPAPPPASPGAGVSRRSP